MPPTGPRPWTPCAGSGQRPADVWLTRGRLWGRCPICQQRISLTKRTERLYPHAERPQGDVRA